MAKQVTKVYGDALFEAGLENSILPALREESREVRRLMEENPGLVSLLNHPQIEKQEKIQVVTEIFDGRISGIMTGFLREMVEKGRQKWMEKTLLYFEAKVKEYQHIGVVYVTAPAELSAGQKQNIENKLLKTTSYRSLEVTYDIDPELIGGLVIRIGDRVVDSSIKNRWESLRQALLKIQLTEEMNQKEGGVAP